MRKFVYYRDDGTIYRVSTSAFVGPPPDDAIEVPVTADVNMASAYVKLPEKTLVSMPAVPMESSPYLRFSPATKTMVMDASAAARDVRGTRNAMLSESDWTQLPDVGLTESERAAWSAYRAALRDVTKQPGFPFSIVWPVPPGK